MGISTQSKVAFICQSDESAWAQPFIDEKLIPTKDNSSGFKHIDVPGAGFWEYEINMFVPIYTIDVRDNGKLIILGTDYYGIIGPARMDLPASLQAVVCQSYSCQNDPQDPTFAVLAKNIRTHDFSDTNPVVEPYFFNLDDLSEEYYEPIEEFTWDDEADDFIEGAKYIGEIREPLIVQRDLLFEKLIKHVQSLDSLDAPFLNAPELATVKGYHQSIDYPSEDEEEWPEAYEGPIPPTLSYSNTEVIGLKPEPLSVSVLFPDVTPLVKEALEKAFAQVQEARDSKTNVQEARDSKTNVQDENRFYKPKVIGRTRQEIKDALLRAYAGEEEDTTGILTFIQSQDGDGDYPLPGYDMDCLIQYIAHQLDKGTFVASELETSTEGFHIFYLISDLVSKRKWLNFID